MKLYKKGPRMIYSVKCFVSVVLCAWNMLYILKTYVFVLTGITRTGHDNVPYIYVSFHTLMRILSPATYSVYNG